MTRSAARGRKMPLLSLSSSHLNNVVDSNQRTTGPGNIQVNNPPSSPTKSTASAPRSPPTPHKIKLVDNGSSSSDGTSGVVAKKVRELFPIWNAVCAVQQIWSNPLYFAVTSILGSMPSFCLSISALRSFLFATFFVIKTQNIISFSYPFIWLD